MPVPPAGSVILLTGASGYIASHIGEQLLAKGYSVRGTTRNAAKGEWMKQMYKDRFGYDAFDYVVVEELENEKAFDKAVEGVSAIVHTASPFHWNVEKPDDFIKPAIAGTVSALRAASKEKAVQRVVITSSYAAILEPKEPLGEHTFTEEDWNQVSIDEVNNKGTEAWRMHWYRASKTLAERAAWDYLKKENPQFDLATVCPPFVLGPIIHQADSPKALNTSIATYWAFLTGEKTQQEATVSAGILCDVRDVAKAHVEALLRPESAGHRFGVATAPFTFQSLVEAAYEDPRVREAFPNAQKGIKGSPMPPQNLFDCSKAVRMWGWGPTPLNDTATDMTLTLLERKKRWDAPGTVTAGSA